MRAWVMMAMLLVTAGTTLAQATPPFFSGAVGYTPQIRVANSGIVTDVEAWVSADRKYVTLGMRNQQAATILQEFAFTRPSGTLGFVGAAVPAPAPDGDQFAPPARSTVLNHVGVQKLR